MPKIEDVNNDSSTSVDTITVETDTKEMIRNEEYDGSMSSSRTTEGSTNTLETKSCNVTLTDLDEDQNLDETQEKVN